MNQEIKKQWVAALRSGEYKQGHGSLCQKMLVGDLTFCCLGVLCDLHRKATPGMAWEPPIALGRLGYLDSTGILPLAVSDWASMQSANPVVSGRSISTFNDGSACDDSLHPHVHIHNFNEIADLIEKETTL